MLRFDPDEKGLPDESGEPTDVLSCLMCGRDTAPRLTAEEIVQMKKRDMANAGVRYRTQAKLAELAALPPETPVKLGRPPGSKNKVRRIADTAPARADRSPISGEIFDEHPEPARAAGGTTP